MTDEIDWYGPEAATFGDRVAAAREQTGMTQAMLAKRLGVRLSTLRGWEDDLSEPRANRLSMLAGLLNVSMMWLITGEGEGVDAPEAGETAREITVTKLKVDSTLSLLTSTCRERAMKVSSRTFCARTICCSRCC